MRTYFILLIIPIGINKEMQTVANRTKEEAIRIIPEVARIGQDMNLDNKTLIPRTKLGFKTTLKLTMKASRSISINTSILTSQTHRFPKDILNLVLAKAINIKIYVKQISSMSLSIGL